MIAINEIFYLPDEQKLEELLQLHYFKKSKIRINWGDIIDFINNQKNTTFYLTREFEMESERSYFTNYILLDTGLLSEDKKPIFLSFIDNGEDKFYSRFVSDTEAFARQLAKNAPQKAKIINTNKNQFEKAYIHMADKRYLEHLPTPIYEEDAVKTTSETKEKEEVIVSKEVIDSGIETSSIKIPNEDVRNIVLDLSQAEIKKEEPKGTKSETTKESQNEEKEITSKTDFSINDELLQDIMGILLSINWSKEELSNTLDDIGHLVKHHVNKHELFADTAPFYYANRAQDKYIVNTGILNLFGDDIYIIYAWKNEEKIRLIPTKLISSKNELLSEGFSIREASIFNTLETPCFKQTILPHRTDVELDKVYNDIEEMCAKNKEYYESFGIEMDEFIERFHSSLLLSIKKSHADNSFGKYAYDRLINRSTLTLPIWITEHKDPDFVILFFEDEIGTIIAEYKGMRNRFKTLQPYSEEW